ncbi:hypothetical protein [Pantoea sp. OXWO6B1]|uniref:hypothetical protein n=1 Tax=Pantoea sp. OXWO6B1 TaxID=1835724 RepID=UPI0007C84287|nr:hypothetical protein [Pantoea sp. OXWO6B1]OAD97861.1 hypothetical protein A6A26_21980 [Pantoea sp. OXWO6B1]
MRKPTQTYDLHIPDDDYKMAVGMERDKANFESSNIWIYLGADKRDTCYAKVGLTLGDLRSRSYSSANPHYHIFCAFQCVVGTTGEQLRKIEKGALAFLDSMFPKRRAYHYESQILSECYYDINFSDFFVLLHDYLRDNHPNNFMEVEHLNEINEDDGSTLAMEFNPQIPLLIRRKYIELIKRY